MKLTMTDIVRQLAGRIALTQTQSKNVADAIFGAITQALCDGEAVSLQGFGRFFLRPPRTGAIAVAPQGRTVGFQGFGHLRNKINAGGLDELDKIMQSQNHVEKREESRQESASDATAIVRISGIPVCQFKLQTVSESGTSFLVREDSVILRNIRVGQEIEIYLQNGSGAAGALFRSRIAHITQANAPETKGHFILGVQILDKMPME